MRKQLLHTIIHQRVLRRAVYFSIIVVVIIVSLATSTSNLAQMKHSYPIAQPTQASTQLLTTDIATQQSPEEDDWWLPDWVEVSPNVGLYGWTGDNTFPPNIIKAPLKTITWKEINPSDGVYDWSKLETLLKGPNPVSLRIYNTDVTHSPTWLQTKYPDLKPMRYPWGVPYPDTLGNISDGYFFPPWHPGIQAEFRKLLQDFKNHDFASNPNLVFMYIPGGWKWDEFNTVFVNEMIQQGMTPDDFITWFKHLIDDYIWAFNGNTNKLVYTGTGAREWSMGNSEWQQKINTPSGGNVLTDYAIQAGVGARDGQTEAFNRFSNLPSWGTTTQTIGDARYMITDDNYPLISDRFRVFGTESECFSECDGMPDVSDYYSIKMATLLMLKLRMNWVDIAEHDYPKAASLIQYSLKEMGKQYYDAPDAWVALREWYDTTDNNFPKPPAAWIHNWERWLIQRDVTPDGITVRTDPITSSWDAIGTSYEARRTDLASGSDYIYFGVSDKFINGGSNDVQIKVTYLDDNNSKWWIEYDSANNGPYMHSSAIYNQSDGRWKTATFRVNNASFQKRQRGNMDFRIYNGGINDITVRFVRVIKMIPPRTYLPLTVSGLEPPYPQPYLQSR